MASRNKTIDLTKDNVSPVIRKVISRIDRSMANQLKESNIPSFKVMEKIITTEAFFMNHLDYEAIYGSNVDILDRMMLSAVCDMVSDDIMESIDESKVGYVGVWDKPTLYNIVAAVVTFMKHDTTGALYFTDQQYKVISQEDLDTLPEGSYMPFADYNPNRFYQIILRIRAMTLDVVKGIMEKLPKVFIYSKDNPLATQLYTTYKNIMTDDMMAVYKALNVSETDDFANQPLSEKKVRMFADYFEKPFLTLLTLIAQESGLSQNVINLMLASSKVHLLYDDPTDKCPNDIGFTFTLQSELTSIDPPIKVEYKTTVGDAIFACVDDNWSKTKKEAFGKALRKFVLNLNIYVINLYVAIVNENKPKDEVFATGLTTAPVEGTSPDQ